MAYDAARGVTVLFGGIAENGLLNGETWEWNGIIWTQRSISVPSPSPRYGHSMVYDSDRGVTVLFGGYAGNYNAETWEWNGSVWTQRTVTGPSGRYDGVLAYDSTRHVTVLFGGISNNNGVNGETWEWNGIAWTQRIVSGPSPRRGHALAYDSTRGVTVLFGGLGAGVIANGETWEWNGVAWTQQMVTGPSARERTAMAYDTTRHVTVLFGGDIGGNPGTPNGEAWEWNGTIWIQRTVSGSSPSPRYGLAMAYDAAHRVTVLVGGDAGVVPLDKINAETWEWDGTGGGTWTQRTTNGPSPRFAHAMTYDSASNRQVIVLFGGVDVVSAMANGETWEWSGSTWVLRAVSGPSPRSGHAMTYDAARGVTVLFGGDIGTGASGDNGETWEWNGSSWALRAVSGPSPRSGHAMTYDAARGITVLFGGFNHAGTDNNETWEWNGATATWTLRDAGGVGRPSPRYSHSMAYDAARGVTVLFGGATNSGSTVNGETWEWNGTTAVWTLRDAGGVGRPSSRFRHAMVYEAARGVTVLFGGRNNIDYGDTWEWNGTGGGTWTQRIVIGPTPRRHHAMTYDAARHETVLFGGYGDSTTYNGETWGLRATCTASSLLAQPFNQLTCPFGPAGFSVTASGSSPLTYQWQYQAGPASAVPIAWTNLVNGDNLVGAQFALHATGAKTRLVVVDHDPTYWPDTTLDPVFKFRCVVTNACGSVTSDEATLEICAADFNCDGFLTGEDFDAYVAAFEAGDPSADFNHDGFVTGEDFDGFVAAFEAGC